MRVVLACLGVTVGVASLVGAQAHLGRAASATVSHESSVSFSTYGASDSQSVTVPAVGNTALIFQFAGKLGTDALSSVSYGGQALTMLSARSQGSTRLEVWYLVNPGAGTKALSWQKTGAAQNVTWGASVYSGVDQTAPFGSVAQAGATQDSGGVKSVTVASATGELVMDAVVFNGGAAASGPAAASGQDQHWARGMSTTEGGSSSKAGGTSVTVGWTSSAGTQLDWALIAVPLKPAAAPPPSPQPPVVVDRPVVTGTASQNETLQTSNGTWSNNPSSFQYSWLRCADATPASCNPIAGASAQSYTLTNLDVGFKIRSRVVASNAAGSSTPADSDPTGTVAAPTPPTGITYSSGSSFSTFGTSDTRPVTVGSAANEILVFQFAGKSGGDQLSSVTYGGTPLTRLAFRSEGSVRLELWYLVAPPAGTAALAWQKTGAAQNVTWGESVYAGVDQTTPFDTASQAGATGDTSPTAKTLNVASISGELVVDAVVFNGGPTTSGPTAGAGQTQRWSTSISTTQGGSSSRPASSPVTMSWTPAGSGAWDWALIAAPLRPSGAPPAGTRPTSTSAPVVSGSAVVGQTLTTTDGVWSNSPTSFSYKWKQCDATGASCTAIGGATANHYAVQAGDLGFRIRSEVTASNVAGPSAPASSEPTATVSAAPSASAPSHVATTSFSTFGASDSQSVTVPAVDSGILIFVFAGKIGADQLSTVTYGGTPLTRLAARGQGSVRLEFWYLVGPPTGTRSLAWTKTGAAQNVTWGASVYSGVNQATPFDGLAQDGASGDSSSRKTLVVPASTNELVVDAVVFNGAAASAGPLPDAGQTARFSRRQSTTQGGSSSKPATSPVTMGWTPSGSGAVDWALIAAPLRSAQPNRAPTDVTLSNSTVAEHQPAGTTVGTLTTTDPDSGQTFAYTLQSAGCGGSFPDNTSFQIAGDQLKTNAVLDQATKASYTICVRSTDNGAPPLSVDKQLTVTVTNANDAPTEIALSQSTVAENQPAGTTIGTLTTTDPDAGDSHTYTLLSSSPSCVGTNNTTAFQIGAGADADKLQTAKTFDFETDPTSYQVCIRTTDGGGAHFDEAFTITITNVNDAPTDIALSPSSIEENKPSGTTVGTLTATDPESGQTHTFALVTTCSGGGPDNGSFAISGSTLSSTAAFDYETKSSYTICVQTTDNGAPAASFAKQLTVTIINVDDPPVTNADSYSGAIGNTKAQLGTTTTGPVVTLTGSVLTANDTDPEGETVTAIAETNPTSGGGSVTINSDGSFVYMPGVGDKNQDDTFTYHVTDGHVATPVAGTATVHIDDFLVWYADANQATNGDGRSASPFNSLGGLNGAGGSGDSDGTGDYLFLYGSASSYTGGLPLEASQRLFGQRHGLVVNGKTLVAPAPAGDHSTIEGGVVLSTDNTIEGIDFGTTGSASVFALSGSSVGTATVDDATSGAIDNQAGGAVSIGGTGNALTMAFSALSSNNSSTNAVSIANATGTFTGGCTLPCSPGALQNATGTDVSIGGGTLGFTLNAAITDSGGQLVNVQNATGGTKDFNGPLSGGSVALAGNTGATIRFDGGMALSSGATTGFSAMGGGTVAVTDPAGAASNTIDSTTGGALDVENTTIHGDGLTFQRLSSNGAARGVVLNTTGTAGGLTVTGSGGTCAEANPSICSGGVIQNGTGADDSGTNPAGTGIVLNSTKSPSFTSMAVHDFTNYAIRGHDVSGFTLDSSVVDGANGTSSGAGTPYFDGSVYFDNLTGSALVRDSVIGGGRHDDFKVVNSTSLALDRLTFDGVTMRDTNNTDGNDAINLQQPDAAGATGAFNVTVKDSFFTATRSDHLQYSQQGPSSSDLVFTGNTISNNSPQKAAGGAGGINITGGGSSSGAATLTANVSHNTSRDAEGPAFVIQKNLGTSGSGGTQSVTFDSNRIGVTGVDNSGSDGGSGLQLTTFGWGTLTATLTNNTILNYENFGMDLQAGAGSATGGNFNLKISGNTVGEPSGDPSGLPFVGIHINSGVVAGDSFATCADFGANTVAGSGNATPTDVRVRQRQATTFRLPGYGGGAFDTAAVSAFVAGKLGGSPVVTAQTSAAGGGFVGGGSSCP